MQCKNLFGEIPPAMPEEIFEILLETEHLKLERILSHRHVTPPGQWYDQERPEWVLLLRGGAGLRFEGEEQLLEMKPGDHLNIPAGCRHRVEHTEADTVWLALHYS